MRLREQLPTASQTGGYNYAHGGSTVTTSQVLRPSLAEQVSTYISSFSSPSSISASDLHVLWGGANDLYSDTTESRASLVAATIHSMVNSLYQAGARQFLVMNVPSLAATPIVQADASIDKTQLNQVVDFYNSQLATEMASASASLPGAKIFEFDAAAFLQQMLNDPTTLGLSNVTDAAAPFDAASFPGLATAPPPAGVDPDAYLFYDGLHPTAAAHRLFGNRVADQLLSVPEPTGFGFVLLFSPIVCPSRRRRLT